MLVAVGNFLIPTTLILEGSEESVSMHVYSWLLSEESLAIASHLIHDNCVQSHHLLLLELVALVLKILNPVERGLSYGHILG